MKTITISDDVYAELARIKRKSFSETIRMLLKHYKMGNRWIDDVFGKIKDIDTAAVEEARRSWKIRSY